MAQRSGRRLFVCFAAVVLGLLGLCAKCWWDHGWLSVRVAFAEEQTAIFEEMREKAASADPTKAIGYLEYAVNYYPSGSKQVAGSSLDHMVERARRSAVREMIADLRRKSGEDLGDDPKRWIAHFQKPGR
jgi:hypothetical protein